MTRKQAVLQAFAVGDAMGMPTEFMTRRAITARFGPLVTGLIAPDQSQNHANLPFASVTDDTEQVVYLLKAYARDGMVTLDNTVKALTLWAEETRAEEKGYIGPSSSRALKAIRQGTDPVRAGEGGSTCGGIMRSPAAVLYRDEADLDEMLEALYICLAPTHGSSTALEAAGAYGAALWQALRGGDMDSILEAARQGAGRLKARAPYEMCAPSCAARIDFAAGLAKKPGAGEVLDTLYDLIGTGLPSADVCAAVFAIFCHAGESPWQAIRMGASVGGDTDTIAALAGALCAAYAGGHDIPAEVLDAVLSANKELLDGALPG